MYILRLDDASEYMDVKKWTRIERMLDKYSIKPLVGIIPNNEDMDLIGEYNLDPGFWIKAKKWQEKGWAIALHGDTHVYLTKEGGINPVNNQSEFAGVPLEEQKRKISNGINLFQKYNLKAKVFFAPSHTFDLNTLKALKLSSDIRVISDTIANDIYKMEDFYFVPQQSGRVRKLPFNLTTFCYHPNNMVDKDFHKLEVFFQKNQDKFVDFTELKLLDRKPNAYDNFLKKMYFTIRALRNTLRGRKYE